MFGYDPINLEKYNIKTWLDMEEDNILVIVPKDRIRLTSSKISKTKKIIMKKPVLKNNKIFF